ncbi:hypothetical protein [Helicobacter typhlonius]|uniref:hypothetical protein n=1 Tax=Helicobacter typhlonius TaxID=76936 RepID=UPI002FE2577F
MKSVFSPIFSFLRLCKRALKRLICYDRASIKWQAINDFARTMEDCYIYRINIATLAYYIKHLQTQCNAPLYLLSDENYAGGGDK